jgi:hypothetical protein
MSDITDLVKAIVALQPPRKIGADEYVARTPFHPDGKVHTKLRRRSFQNGRRLDEMFLTEEEIRLTNALVPGKFLDGLVVVKEMDAGPDTDLHIFYRSATADQRIALSAHASSFRALLMRCLVDAVSLGLADPGVLLAGQATDDPLKSMVLPKKEAPSPRQRVQPAIPGRDDTPFEYPETTGTSADEAAAEESEDTPPEDDESPAPQQALHASAIDLLAAGRPGDTIAQPKRRPASTRELR